MCRMEADLPPILSVVRGHGVSLEHVSRRLGCSRFSVLVKAWALAGAGVRGAIMLHLLPWAEVAHLRRVPTITLVLALLCLFPLLQAAPAHPHLTCLWTLLG